MLQQMVSRLLGLLWHTPHTLYLMLGMAAYASARRWWQQRRQRLLTEESKDWPTHRGRVVAVQAVRDGDEEKKGKWTGLLTYSYIVDEVEIGEYRQLFNSEAEADDWVRALRDEVVTVAVDPKDQRRSIWIAKEANATRKAAEIAWLKTETANLPVWVEITRIVTFAVAVAGVGASLVMEVHQLRTMYVHTVAMNRLEEWWISAGASACSALAAYVFSRRFPGSRMEDIGRRFKDPLISAFLKVLGIVEGSALLAIWWEWGGGGDAIEGEPWNALLTVFCGGLFAGAAVALWVAGRGLPVEHELAPERHGLFKL